MTVITLAVTLLFLAAHSDGMVSLFFRRNRISLSLGYSQGKPPPNFLGIHLLHPLFTPLLTPRFYFCLNFLGG